jgi:hypothetical protein
MGEAVATLACYDITDDAPRDVIEQATTIVEFRPGRSTLRRPQ